MNTTQDQKKKSIPDHTRQASSGSSIQTADESNNDSQLFFVEELSDDLIRKFQSQQVTPYFKSVFADLVLRSQPAKDPRFNNLCDKVTLVEYMNLPGILADRFCALMGSSAKQNEGRVNYDKFLHAMSQVYSSTVEEKMKMTFEMYDFDQDGRISAEDIRLVLSYIPIRNEHKSQLCVDDSDNEDHSTTLGSGKPRKVSANQEGLYLRSEGKDMNEEERLANNKQIKKFVQLVFKQKSTMNCREFIDFNTNVSSEMFISIISILQERLPCSHYVYRAKKTFKQQEFMKNKRSLIAGLLPVTANMSKTEKDENALVAKAEEMCLSPLKAIASPKLLKDLSLLGNKKSSTFKPENQKSSSQLTTNNSSTTKKSQLEQADFKIKKRVDIDCTRQQALSNSQKSCYSSELADSDIDPDRHESIVRLIEGSKMRRLQDAKRNWSKNHGANSPFRANFSQEVLQLERQGSESHFNSGVVKIQNLKLVDKDQTLGSPGIKSSSQFSKTKEVNSAIRGARQQSSFKRNTNLPKINTNQNPALTGANAAQSPTIRPNKRHFETYQEQTVEPCSPLILLNQNNNLIVQDMIVDNFSKDQTKLKHELKLEGKCFLKTRTDRFKEHWAQVVGKDLMCFRNEGDNDQRVMHCLAGTFIQETQPEMNPDTGSYLYPVKIVLPPNKSRILYFGSIECQAKWLKSIRKIVGEFNINDFYDLQNNLGKGQFGVVKLAKHKKNGNQVAIKTINKSNMKPIEVFQQRREIEVLKMCQHQNIIKLIDLFESSEQYYIVIEYMQGKDLFDYIAKRSYKLPEERAKAIIYQIMLGVRYLHSFGIVHRDLKLENIMMTESNESGQPKIVDFGLSKIIGPSETATEPFGTLGYVAPEVLKKSPYSFSCDIWSLGCILYALLSGSLPFDHNEQKELMRMTMDEALKFDLSVWSTISQDCKSLISELLRKTPANRISLDDAIKHPWFDSVRSKYTTETA